MSIWSSITSDNQWRHLDLDAIPERDQFDYSETPTGSYVDVATALSWNPFVRLVLNDETAHASLILTTDEASRLVQQLNEAIRRVNIAYPPEAQ